MTATSSPTRAVSAARSTSAIAEAVALDRRQQVDVIDESGHAVQFGDADLARGGDVGGVATDPSARGDLARS